MGSRLLQAILLEYRGVRFSSARDYGGVFGVLERLALVHRGRIRWRVLAKRLRGVTLSLLVGVPLSPRDRAQGEGDLRIDETEQGVWLTRRDHEFLLRACDVERHLLPSCRLFSLLPSWG